MQNATKRPLPERAGSENVICERQPTPVRAPSGCRRPPGLEGLAVLARGRPAGLVGFAVAHPRLPAPDRVGICAGVHDVTTAVGQPVIGVPVRRRQRANCLVPSDVAHNIAAIAEPENAPLLGTPNASSSAPWGPIAREVSSASKTMNSAAINRFSMRFWAIRTTARSDSPQRRRCEGMPYCPGN